MAANKNNSIEVEEPLALVDPIYEKFTKSVIRALGSTEFYQYFMESIAAAQNTIQFSNRKLVKTVDISWVDAVEDALPGFQTIINTPRNVIKEEELIVNVANAKRTGTEVVQHLAQHASLVERFDEDTGDVRPSRLMQRYREDSTELYENRLVYTTLEAAYHFVKVRHDAIFQAMNDEFGAKLKVQTLMDSPTEHVSLDMFLQIRKVDSFLDTDDKNFEVFSRISKIYRVLGMYMNTDFARTMSKLTRVKGSVTKTNVLKKNPSYRKIAQLWDFLRSYESIGYTIRVVEQNPEVNEKLQQDIYHNVLFNYLVLKGYLQDEEDRQVAVKREKKRVLKPKFIKEIIEELTEDYDLPDVEIRKVLIEELTKAQLMKEESAERHRLVEEQRQRKKAEEERIRQEKAAEKERIRKEKEAERERIRLEKEYEQQRLLQERMEREAEIRRRSDLIKKELQHFSERLAGVLEARQDQQSQEQQVMERLDFSDAVVLLEEEETRRREAAARMRKQRQQERELQRIQEEQDRIRREEEEERERLRLEAEAERIRIETEEAERRAMEMQREHDMQILQPVIAELEFFQVRRPKKVHDRALLLQAKRTAVEQHRLQNQNKR